ncbi:hypothetical protein [Salinibaculum rarum]|uniref:hypothetical protein n=1 Tax=Salinibaculum rarum TaxID=3058903 RepID=UPI00265F4ECB|nr:hypothetical protein [Salinibaculum sp. KK48]
MSENSSDDDLIKRVDLTDDYYEVIQSLIRNKYRAEDADGNVVLRGKQKILKLKEEFPFETPDGDAAFTVNAEGVLDIAGDYTLVDAETEEEVVVLDKNYTMFAHKWKLRDPDTESLIGRIESQNTFACVVRSFSTLVATFLPNKYEITDHNGEHVGTIEGQLSLQDKYEITIDDASSVSKETIVAAAMVIDALERN